MMLSLLPADIACNAFCLIASLLIAYQVIRHPNKLRLFILGYTILTLPASIINALQRQGLLSTRGNALEYLISTLLMTVTHFSMMLDCGYRLRAGEGNWKHPLVLIGILSMCCTIILLVIQIIVLALNLDGAQKFPLKDAFIASIVCSILGNSAVFTYTFMPLIYWREKRLNEGHSRTTALGIWFFLIQNIWYFLYGALYIWFFIENSWKYFDTLLYLDYVLRFVENLLYTWPPPISAINYLSSILPTSTSSINMPTRKTVGGGGDGGSSTNNTSHHVNMSSERYNKEEHVEYGETDPSSDQKSINSKYGSRVTIVT